MKFSLILPNQINAEIKRETLIISINKIHCSVHIDKLTEKMYQINVYPEPGSKKTSLIELDVNKSCCKEFSKRIQDEFHIISKTFQ